MVDVVIGDGHVLFADLLSEVLAERGYDEPEGLGDAEALIAEVRRRRPPVCLVDHRSLVFDRGHLLDELVAAAGDHTKVVVVSSGPVGPRADTAGALGVDGVLDKRADLSTLLDALRRVLAGEVVTVGAVRDGPPQAREARRLRQRAESLTARERECLTLLVDGCTTEQIEQTLSISVMTVRSHVRSLLRKLGAHSRLEAASLAVRYELVPTTVPRGRAEPGRDGLVTRTSRPSPVGPTGPPRQRGGRARSPAPAAAGAGRTDRPR